MGQFQQNWTHGRSLVHIRFLHLTKVGQMDRREECLMPLLENTFSAISALTYLRQHLSPERSPSAPIAKKNPQVCILLETSENPVSGPRVPGCWSIKTAVVLHWSRAWGRTQICHVSLRTEKQSLLHRVTIWKAMWTRAHQQLRRSGNGWGHCWDIYMSFINQP